MKAAFFLGRIHHAHKLLPVASALTQSNIDIEFLVCDNSINIDPATEYLPIFNILEFKHARDYVDGYNNQIDKMANYAMRYSVGELSSAVPPFWISSAIREAAVDYYGFNGYLEQEKPNLVFALHEQNFFVKILFYLAQQQQIPTYSLMEGIILEREEEALGKYSDGTVYTSTLFSWSEYDKQFYSDPDKIYPVGPTHLDEWLQVRQDESNWQAVKANLRTSEGLGVNDKIITFAPPRLDLYRGDFMGTLSRFLEWTRNRGVKAIVKLHPFQADAVVKDMAREFNRYSHVAFTNNDNSIKFLAMADAVMTQTSTVGMEAVALGIPLIEVDMDYYGLEQPLSMFGAATLLEGEDWDKVIKVLNGNGDDKRINEFKKERLPLADGNSIKRIVDYIRVNQWIR